MTQELSAAQARRIAVVAQGFGRARPKGTVTGARLSQLLEQIAVLQVDSVNVLTRSHYLPVFSRLGSYSMQVLDQAAEQAPRRMVEGWSHMASFTTPATYTLLHPMMAAREGGDWAALQRVRQEHPGLVEQVLAVVSDDGPVTAAQVGQRLGHDRAVRAEWGWNWNAARVAIEHCFHRGLIASAGRNSAFERRYDLIERVLPSPWAERVHAGPYDSEQCDAAARDLVAIAAAAFGVATEPDLRDYFRLRPERSQRAVRELVEAGRLVPVTVQGWDRQAYLHPDATLPSRVQGSALLSPFDSLVWFRPRTLRVFGMHYRIEIYTPAARREYGYYVLPYLMGDRLVARVDLKRDRRQDRLLVQAAHLEANPAGGSVPPERVAGRLAADLHQMAGWLGLSSVEVQPVGNLSHRLEVSLASAAFR